MNYKIIGVFFLVAFMLVLNVLMIGTRMKRRSLGTIKTTSLASGSYPINSTYEGYNPFCSRDADSGKNKCGDMQCDQDVQQTCANSSTYPLSVEVSYSGTKNNDTYSITKKEVRSIVSRTNQMNLYNASDSYQTIPLGEHDSLDLCGVVSQAHPVRTPWETDSFDVSMKRTLTFVQCSADFLEWYDSFTDSSASDVHHRVLQGLNEGKCEITNTCDKDDLECDTDMGYLGTDGTVTVIQALGGDGAYAVSPIDVHKYQIPRKVRFPNVTICGHTRTRVASQVSKWTGTVSRHEPFPIDSVDSDNSRIDSKDDVNGRIDSKDDSRADQAANSVTYSRADQAANSVVAIDNALKSTSIGEYYTYSNQYVTYFNTAVPFVLKSVVVHANRTSASLGVTPAIALFQAASVSLGAIVHGTPIAIQQVEWQNADNQRLELNFTLSVASNYYLAFVDFNNIQNVIGPSLWRDFDYNVQTLYPRTFYIDSQQIYSMTRTNMPSTPGKYYYFFYEWEIVQSN